MENFYNSLIKNNDWCVKGINENLQTQLLSEYPKLHKKFIEKFVGSEKIGFTIENYYFSRTQENGELWLDYTHQVPIGKTLIDFQEFKKYVLEMDEEDLIKENYSFLKEILTNLSIK